MEKASREEIGKQHTHKDKVNGQKNRQKQNKKLKLNAMPKSTPEKEVRECTSVPLLQKGWTLQVRKTIICLYCLICWLVLLKLFSPSILLL